MKAATALKLARFLLKDPDGFTSALINTIDTHQENMVNKEGVYSENWNPTNRVRQNWAIGFLLSHDNGEDSEVSD